MTIGAIDVIQPLTTIVVQPVLTPILAAVDLSRFDLLIFAFMNDDPVNSVDVTIQTGEAADAADAEFMPVLTVPPASGGLAGQRTLVVGPGQVRSYYRASGVAAVDPVSCRWTLRGVRRPIIEMRGLR